MQLKPTKRRYRDPNSRTILMSPFRVSEAEEKIIREKAEKLTGGNLSEFIRYAALNFQPTAKDLIEAPKKRGD